MNFNSIVYTIKVFFIDKLTKFLLWKMYIKKLEEENSIIQNHIILMIKTQ